MTSFLTLRSHVNVLKKLTLRMVSIKRCFTRASHNFSAESSRKS